MSVSLQSLKTHTKTKGRAFILDLSMMSFQAISLLSLSLLLGCSALPLCTDSRAPLPLKSALTFCPYNGSVCCDANQDLILQKQFQAMNVSDSACASLLKAILCARCDQFSAELFTIESQLRTVPILCNSSLLVNSKYSSAAKDFCTEVWDSCQNVSIKNSPFAPYLQGGILPGAQVNSTPKLADLWQSQKDFCGVFGGSSGDGQACFDGGPVLFNNSETTLPPSGLCIEKIGNGSYLNMVPHPDGSNRVFLSNQQGKIWLATVPEEGSGGTLVLDESSPFHDLTDEVHFDSEFGLMGLAFHPDFVNNGRFFVSFNCDKVKWASCSGRCSCNSALDCDPSQLGSDNGAQPCQYQSVIAEYTVNATSSTPSQATTASPSEVRRIFTMGLPFTSHHGGQILFGPTDKYLYFMMGDGGSIGDPFNFAQNKKSLLGKIMRLDIDNMPSEAQISNLDLWGNYSIPKDNPYSGDKELQPEIWALGLRNPWRCSFDSERSSYFMCADVGQEVYEEVDLITKGGNYGWRVYEGPYLYTPQQSPGGNTSLASINPIPPVMGYNHSAVNVNEGSASITGGYFYRSTTDPCMSGRYLYADLYAGYIWAGTESPADSGNFSSSSIPFKCAKDSPLACKTTAGVTLPELGYIFSFGEDNSKDVYLLANTGVYRVVQPSRCNYTCSKEVISSGGQPPSSSTSPSSACQKKNVASLFLFSLFLLLSGFGL